MSDDASVTDPHAQLILHILQAIETGSAAGNYGLISLMHDGEDDRLQVTLGIQFDEKSGDLKKVLSLYQSRGGQAAEKLSQFIPRVNTFATGSATVLSLDHAFQSLLRPLGADPLMREVQDAVFDQETWGPAKAWADQNGFALSLSQLVISDSFLQSGRIFGFLRNRFPEATPARGGDEKAWIRAYVAARHDWLSSSGNEAVRSSAYRTRFLKSLLEAEDWALASPQYVVNDVQVKGASLA